MLTKINIGTYSKEIREAKTLGELKYVMDKLTGNLSKQFDLQNGEFVTSEQLEKRIETVGSTSIVGPVAWGDVTGKPSTFPPADHNHDGLYLGLSGKAADADKLDNHDSSYFQVAGSYLTDAPADNSLYGRKNNVWEEILAGGGNGSDAIIDLGDRVGGGEIMDFGVRV